MRIFTAVSNSKSSAEYRVQTGLLGDYVFRLRAFLTLCHFHRDLLAFFQRFETLHLNGCVVNEYVLTTFAFDKAKSFIVVEPLYGS